MFDTMPLRAKVILSIMAGVIAVSAIAVVIWGVVTFSGRQATETVDQSTPTGVPDQIVNTPPPATPQPAPAPTPPAPVAPLTEKDPAGQTEQELTAIAMPFVARLGTFSNQSYYDNLPPLMQFMTPRMQAWAQDKIDQSQKLPIDPLYVGTTTKALSIKVDASDASTATVTVSTQRKESKGTVTNARVYNQDMTVKFVKNNGVWIVDDAVWVAEQ